MGDRFRVQLFSEGARSEEIVGSSEVTEHLRRIGLEWKTADYFHNRTAIILVQPFEDEDDLNEARARLTAVEAALGV